MGQKVDLKTELPGESARLPARNVSPHGQVTVLSMMKDEGPYVLEWVAHHLALGFTDLVVYTNDCSDGTDDMLIRLQELGLAHHRRNDIPEGLKPQPSALKYAHADPVVGASDWLLTCDADEFLCIRHGDGTIDGLLDAIEGAGGNGMVITWRIFGSGGVQHWSRAPVTEQYLMAAPQMWNKGWGVKTLFRFDPDIWKLGIHRPKMKNKVLDTAFPQSVRWLNGSGQPMEDYFKFRGWRSIVRTVGYDWAQMNHYAVKSIDSYAIRKFRGNVNNKKDKYNSDYWSLQDRNEVRDDTMLRYGARRKALFDGLLTDPVLRRLHHAATDRVEARLAAFKGTAAYDDLVADLKAAGEVPISKVSAKPPKARDPGKISARMSDVEQRTGAGRDAEMRQPVAERSLAPTALYTTGAVEPAGTGALDWVTNHEIALPADPRIFTPAGLVVLSQGKFQRNIARNLPRMPSPGARVLEIGAGCGFLAALLARERPDLTIAVAAAADRAGTIRAIWARNGLGDRASLTLTTAPDDPAALLGHHQPQALLLGDPALTPAALDAALDAMTAPPPLLVLLLGRLWAARHGDVADFAAVLARHGCRARLPMDPQVTAAFASAAAAAGAAI